MALEEAAGTLALSDGTVLPLASIEAVRVVDTNACAFSLSMAPSAASASAAARADKEVAFRASSIEALNVWVRALAPLAANGSGGRTDPSLALRTASPEALHAAAAAAVIRTDEASSTSRDDEQGAAAVELHPDRLRSIADIASHLVAEDRPKTERSLDI